MGGHHHIAPTLAWSNMQQPNCGVQLAPSGALKPTPSESLPPYVRAGITMTPLKATAGLLLVALLAASAVDAAVTKSR